MSQAHGRYSGSRDKGQRQSRQPSKATSHRQNKPYVKAPPTRDPVQTASIFKTRSFKLLVDLVGAENIALGLDSNLTRVAELVNGERFTPETQHFVSKRRPHRKVISTASRKSEHPESPASAASGHARRRKAKLGLVLNRDCASEPYVTGPAT